MERNIFIGKFLKAYAVDKPYEWEKRQLASIDRPSAYRIENFIIVFLVYDPYNKYYKLVYYIEKYTFQGLNRLKKFDEGLYLLRIDKDFLHVENFHSLNSVLYRGQTIEFEGIKFELLPPKYLDVFFHRSFNSYNFRLLGNNKPFPFSPIENVWIDYISEVFRYEDFAKELPALFYKYVKLYLTTAKELEKCDIRQILKDLSIEVYEVFRNKVGGDDSYFVHEVRSVSYDMNEIDNYLKEYLKLGDREVHRDSGYTSAYNLRIPDLKTGKICEKDVDEVRQCLVNEYSKENHIFANIGQWLEQYLNLTKLPTRHRYSNGLEAYLFSPIFSTTVEKLLGGGCYVREWDNFDEHLMSVNEKLKGLTWWE